MQYLVNGHFLNTNKEYKTEDYTKSSPPFLFFPFYELLIRITYIPIYIYEKLSSLKNFELSQNYINNRSFSNILISKWNY